MSEIPRMFRPHVLYRMFDAADELLYIGITIGAAERWAHHRKEKHWWPDVATIRLEHHPNYRAALKAEQAAVKAEEPRYNMQDTRLHPNSHAWRAARAAELAAAQPSPGSRSNPT